MANQLPAAKRAKILFMLLEGMSMRSICRVEKVNWRTVDKLLNDAASYSRSYHRRKLQEIDVNAIQCDELWSFCYAKQKNAKTVTGDPEHAGDVWTWTAIDPDTKLLIAYRIGDRIDRACRRFIKDLQSRLSYGDKLKICTDGNASYIKAIKRYFGRSVKYLQLVKTHTDRKLDLKHRQVYGEHTTDKASTSFVERFNLTVRMSLRRYSRKTNGFSKAIDNHKNMVDLFALYYNFIRPHETLGTTPAVAARIALRPHSLDWLVGRMERRQVRERHRQRDRVRLPIK